MGLGIFGHRNHFRVPTWSPRSQLPSRSPRSPSFLPAVKFEAPKLIVPKDLPHPKLRRQNSSPPRFSRRISNPRNCSRFLALCPPRVIYTGSFGSSATPTVNAPIEKVQTGGFGDPNGLPGEGKPSAKLTAAKLGSFDLPEGAGTGNGTGGAKGIKGTIASAGFGNGVAQPGQGDGPQNGQGVQASGFAAQQVATNNSAL